MKIKINIFLLIAGVFFFHSSIAQTLPVKPYKDTYRPQIHFSPKAHWMNDPNGMVYYKGIYHLFFQYYPNGTTWGPMHWGHAESKDIIHWKELPIALYPDSLGYIFSGSAVVDSNNTSGFGKEGKVPLVAIFTSHDPKGERMGTNKFQNESIAYSLDNGTTWTKYSGNPVLHNPGIRDFRDPKVMWYAPDHKWVMTLATKDRITFYSSPDFKSWTKESDFGSDIGAHGGVFECPDLFPLKLNGKTYWVLIVNINPGGPNGGSATQYFVGQFNRNKFIPVDTAIRWLDYGPDEYAGITWSNTGSRRIFLGWMSNWEYANVVPTVKWRSAMTIPRELSLKNVNGRLLVSSTPIKEIKGLAVSTKNWFKPGTNGLAQERAESDGNVLDPGQYEFKIKCKQIESFKITLSNELNETLIVGYDAEKKQYFIDRTNSGKTDFQKDFKGRFVAPRLTAAKGSDITLVIDAASVELFADGGLTVMTGIFFPKQPFNKLQAEYSPGFAETGFKIIKLRSAWK
jgi:fructan beta-fructosidase